MDRKREHKLFHWLIAGWWALGYVNIGIGIMAIISHHWMPLLISVSFGFFILAQINSAMEEHYQIAKREKKDD